MDVETHMLWLHLVCVIRTASKCNSRGCNTTQPIGSIADNFVYYMLQIAIAIDVIIENVGYIATIFWMCDRMWCSMQPYNTTDAAHNAIVINLQRCHHRNHNVNVMLHCKLQSHRKNVSYIATLMSENVMQHARHTIDAVQLIDLQ